VIQFRDYQKQAIDSAMDELREVNSTLLVSPTGTGKTVIMAGIVRRSFPGRVMIIAHREELIFQARDKISAMAGVPVCVEMADLRAKDGFNDMFGLSPVVVSSIQTQNSGGDGGRMSRFDPWQFDLLLIDEAHHACADSYRRVIDYYRSNPALRVVGVTATPDRADELALGQIFDTVAFDYEVSDAIRDGYLVPIRQRLIQVDGLDFSAIKTTAGDLNGKQLAEVMEEEHNLHEIAAPTLEIAGERKTLLFASSVKHAERLAEIFNRHRQGCAEFVCGKTPKEIRRERLQRYAEGEIQFLCNVGVLTEGYDDPSTELVVIARPTKSRSLYCQMVGRGTRVLPGVIDGLENAGADARCAAIADSEKPSVEILDFAGNSGRHKLITTADILGGKECDEIAARALKNIRERGGASDMAEQMKQAELELQEEKQREEAAKRARLRARAKYQAREVNPFDVLDITPPSAHEARPGRQLSPKQADLIRKHIGIEPEERPYHEMKRLLDEQFRRWNENLCSFKQAKILSKYGYPTDLGRDDASRVIDAIAANGWKKPEGVAV